MTKEQIGTVDAEAGEITTSGESVTGKHLLADDGKEKEANTLDPIAGAGSAAPASSGIPSAMTQQNIARTVAIQRNVKP